MGELFGAALIEIGSPASVSVVLHPVGSRFSFTNSLFVSLPYKKEIKTQKNDTTVSYSEDGRKITFKGTLSFAPIELGFVEFDSFVLHSESRLKLWYGVQTIESKPFSFRIMPAMNKIPEMRFREIISRQRLLYQGSRLMARNVVPDQYYTSREYRYPDPMRFIDQRKSAKFGTLLTKVFDSLHQNHLVIILDLGRGLCGSIKSSQKKDYYLSAAIALSRQAVQAGDRVSFVAFSDQVHLIIPPSTSHGSFDHLLRGGPLLAAHEVASNYQILEPILQRIAPQRSIIVLLSDCSLPSVQENIFSTVPGLCKKHLFLTLGLLDSSFSLNEQLRMHHSEALSLDEYSHLLYTYWVNDNLELFNKKIGNFGGSSLTIPEDFWLSACTKVYDRLRSSMQV